MCVTNISCLNYAIFIEISSIVCCQAMRLFLVPNCRCPKPSLVPIRLLPLLHSSFTSSSPLHVFAWFSCRDCKAVESGAWTKDGVAQTMQHVTPACPRELCRGHCCRRPLIYWAGARVEEEEERHGQGQVVMQVRWGFAGPFPGAHAFNCRLWQLEIRICQWHTHRTHFYSPHSFSAFIFFGATHLYAFFGGPSGANSSCRLFCSREIGTCVSAAWRPGCDRCDAGAGGAVSRSLRVTKKQR